MKALHYHGPRNVAFVDIPKPEAGPGQVVVKIVYCGICGTDIHAYSMEGIFNWELVLGHEPVGYVEQVGEGVDFVALGDRVAVGPPGGRARECTEPMGGAGQPDGRAASTDTPHRAGPG